MQLTLILLLPVMVVVMMVVVVVVMVVIVADGPSGPKTKKYCQDNIEKTS